MRPLSSLGVGLSLVFGCLFMALVAEIYYLFWWKKRKPNPDVEGEEDASSAGELFYFCCGKKPSSLWRSRALIPREHCTAVAASEDGEEYAYPDGAAAELMELHNLSGPARFLFTIKEETKEDMESEDGRSRGDDSRKGSGRTTSDALLLSAETPYFTPLSSPPFFTPPLTPMGCCSPHGFRFSPLSEQLPMVGDDRGRIGFGSSPPPKFMFLKDAEEKLYRKTLMEEAMRVHRNGAALSEETPSSLASSSSSAMGSEEEDGSFITNIIGRTSQDRARHQHHHSAASSQVIPLPSSPSSTGRRPAQGKTHFP